MGIFDLFSSDNERAAADSRIGGLNRGYDLASGLFGQGRDAVTSAYGQAAQPFQTLFNQGQQGSAAYGDAVGLGGQAGIQRATQNFQSLPGYQAGLEGGLDQIDRRAASRGMLGSGNTNQDTIKFAGDYANKNYGDYVSRLLPSMGQQTTGAQGLGSVYTGLGNQQNASFAGQGGLGYQTQTGIGNADAAYELSLDQTGRNQLGGIMGGLNTFGRLAGGFGY